MIAAVLCQFGLGCLALLLRFSENPCWRCASRCGRCWGNCFRCCCRCFLPAAGGRCCACLEPVAWVLAHAKIRWYWFLLAGHVGFLLREAAVISLLGGWYFEVALAHGAIWLTLLLVLWEVWRFSLVRARAPKTVDQVLDMLLLPLNYGFFAALCVRILKLQSTDENAEIVTAVIDSADIWESWALWSVLELFVLVVDVAARRDPRRQNDSEYLETIKVFKQLSLHGVKAFFLILTGFIALDVVVKGVVAPYVPTACNWLYKDCMSCRDWYHLHINPVAQSIIYILCTFALIFVFTFERSFADYLHCIQPYWKFWGVKCVVTVTYFQWLVISYCFGLDNNQIYLVHCIACCVEMPLLAALHASCAYPYGKAWLERLLDHVPAEVSEQEPQECVQEPPLDSGADAPTPPTPEALGAQGEADEPVQQLQESTGRQCSSCLLYIILWIGCSYGMARLIFFVVPPSYDTSQSEPIYNFMCNKQDLGQFVKEKSSMHWVLPQNAEGQLRIPGTAGVWLPLCGATYVECAVGYQGSPSLSCSPEGEYAWSGGCKEVSCGPPLKLPHATAQYDHRAWTRGMHVKYLCDKGYTGNPIATCMNSGNYSVHGECVEVDCPSPPRVRHATPQINPDHPIQKFKSGTHVSYQCEAGYRGRPVGMCKDDGQWSLKGHCTAVCGTPPVLRHAIEQFNRNATDITVGQRLLYKCEPGYGGHPVAVCDEDGKYNIEDTCKIVCEGKPKVPHATPNIDVDHLQWPVGSEIRYSCDAGFKGDPVSECTPSGQWKWHLPSNGKCTYTGCGSLDTFLSNVTSSWREIMEIKEKLNFTSSDDGDVVFFRCKKGYIGSPRASCIRGHWKLEAACVVECAPPPRLAHAIANFDVAEAQHGWTVGTTITYRCDSGYGGVPLAECSPDRQWKFQSSSQCTDLGCGSLDDFLSSVSGTWHDAMHVESTINFTSREQGDVVIFQCQPGYSGNAQATCVNRHWQLAGSCVPYTTAHGCSCQVHWPLCKGWFGTNCEAWYGCTGRSVADQSYGWCQVQKGSCARDSVFMGQEPSWDYCSAADVNVTWARQTMPDQGMSGASTMMLVVCLCAASGLGVFTWKKARCCRPRNIIRSTSVELEPEVNPSLEDNPRTPLGHSVPANFSNDA